MKPRNIGRRNRQALVQMEASIPSVTDRTIRQNIKETKQPQDVL